MKRLYFLATALFLLCFHVCAKSPSPPRISINLSGKWNFELDSENKIDQNNLQNIQFNDIIILPGTTDSNKKGVLNEKHDETTFLSRAYKYIGKAWYSKVVELTKEWDGKQITLFLERTRPSMVWVDGKLVGNCNYLSVPHRYDLTNFLKPGKHTITICVDNGASIPGQIRANSHSCTESTQTNWNGIIGRMELQGANEQHITSMQAYPQLGDRSVKIKISLAKKLAKKEKITINAASFNTPAGHKPKPVVFPLEPGQTEYEFVYPLGKDALTWSEFSPAMYRLTANLGKTDRYTVNFGLRDFKIDGKQFTINGTKTFLRGKHDACVFPLTAHTPMNVEEWQRYFGICKEYGINHVRFHSWCPPAACFEAADLEGIYLQPELTIWGGFSKEAGELMNFLMKDGEQIQREYSNSPSFVMFALGNELNGDVEMMKSFINRFRQIETRHFYGLGSNNFLGQQGYIEGEDFMVTCRVGTGEGYTTHARASFSFADADEGGYLNNTYPNSGMNFRNALKKSPIPVIGHETGQFQIYPDYAEMKKYTGVLEPRNFEVFRTRLQKAGMIDQAGDFMKASGAWSALLYRADIEMNLRTHDMAGFQLLDLQDYSGQGSAFVGILDAFMDSKGLIAPEKWREFCSEVVPLFVTEKFCWSGGEKLSGSVEIANYSEISLSGKKILWRLVSGNAILQQGTLVIPAGSGLLETGTLSVDIPATTQAKTAVLELGIEGTAYKNSYALWLYPSRNDMRNPGDVIVANSLTDDVLNTLRGGGKVLLMPNKNDCKASTVGGLFQSDYWNYRMFLTICESIKKPASPGTLGLLTNPSHPLFNNFPTDFHTNWQWFSIIKNSYPLILDKLPQEYKPIVQVIDNIERNHKLGLVFEFTVEGGKLLVCMADLEAAKDKPEVRQFYNSMINYMESGDFNPDTHISASALSTLIAAGVEAGKIKTLNNISY